MKQRALIIKSFLLSLFLTGCSLFYPEIGLKKHVPKLLPRKIIWFYIPGLSYENLMSLKVRNFANEKPLVFENFVCTGLVWTYDLYKLRPSLRHSFLGQIAGSRNVQDQCLKANQTAIWEDLAQRGYTTINYVTGLDPVKSDFSACREQRHFKKTYFFQSIPRKDSSQKVKTYHFEQGKQNINPGFYFDQSCNEDNCFSNLTDNIVSLQKNIIKDSPYFNFVISENLYHEFLKSNQMEKAYDRLRTISKAIQYFTDNSDDKTLILVSSSNGIHLNFPAQGKQWGELGTTELYQEETLISPIFAQGASAERFCGFMHASEIKSRILLE